MEYDCHIFSKYQMKNLDQHARYFEWGTLGY